MANKPILQDASPLPGDQQTNLRDSIASTQSTGGTPPLPPRVPGLNRGDRPLLLDPDAPVPPEFVGDGMTD